MANKENNKSYESIRTKLRKLQALAERGEAGEAMNARRAIERMCEQYGIKLEDLYDNVTLHWYTFNIGRDKNSMALFIRCLEQITNITDEMHYVRLTRSAIKAELPAYAYAELKGLLEWHKENYKQELEAFKDNFFLAYIKRHNLLMRVEGQSSTDERELTAEDIERILKINAISRNMSNNTYHKQLE